MARPSLLFGGAEESFQSGNRDAIVEVQSPAIYIRSLGWDLMVVYTFPNGVHCPRVFLTLAKNPRAFDAAYGSRVL